MKKSILVEYIPYFQQYIINHDSNNGNKYFNKFKKVDLSLHDLLSQLNSNNEIILI